MKERGGEEAMAAASGKAATTQVLLITTFLFGISSRLTHWRQIPSGAESPFSQFFCYIWLSPASPPTWLPRALTVMSASPQSAP